MIMKRTQQIISHNHQRWCPLWVFLAFSHHFVPQRVTAGCMYNKCGHQLLNESHTSSDVTRESPLRACQSHLYAYTVIHLINIIIAPAPTEWSFYCWRPAVHGGVCRTEIIYRFGKMVSYSDWPSHVNKMSLSRPF